MPQMDSKTLSLLGLARRAGKLQWGFDAVVLCTRERKAALLLCARDISEKTYRNISFEGARGGIPVLRLPEDRSTVGHACSVKAGVLAVTDEGFAAALLSQLQGGKCEKEECTL